MGVRGRYNVSASTVGHTAYNRLGSVITVIVIISQGLNVFWHGASPNLCFKSLICFSECRG